MGRVSLFAVFIPALCLSHLVLADEPASIPPATTEQIQQTVDRAIVYMQAESAAWLNTRQCAACHHMPMPLWALGEAERQGYAIDKKFLADTIESLLGSRDKLMASKIFPNPGCKALRHPSRQGPEGADGGSLRQAARNDANHDRRVAGTAARRRWLEPDCS